MAEPEWEELQPEERDTLQQLFPGGRLTDLLRRGEALLPRRLLPTLPTLRTLPVRQDDIFILSYPKVLKQVRDRTGVAKNI